jgi:hypothetical protein
MEGMGNFRFAPDKSGAVFPAGARGGLPSPKGSTPVGRTTPRNCAYRAGMVPEVKAAVVGTCPNLGDGGHLLRKIHTPAQVGGGAAYRPQCV